MPGMGGIELCKHIRGLDAYERTPIIMLTTASSRKQIDAAFSAGATDYLTKPFDVAVLGKRLRFAMDLSNQDQMASISEEGAQADALESESHLKCEIPTDILLAKTDRLIELRSLKNYLGQLTRSRHEGFDVQAIRMDPIRHVRAEATDAEFLHVLSEVANSISAALEAQDCLPAYAGRGNFVSVSQHTVPASPGELEGAIRSSVLNKNLQYDNGTPFAVEISVGLSLRPPASKLRSVKQILKRAIARADNRFHSKHKMPEQSEVPQVAALR